MQNRNWFYFEFSVESSSFTFNNSKTEKFKLTFEGLNRPVCHFFWFHQSVFLSKFAAFHPRTVKRIVTALDTESPFSLFFSFSASLKNSSPREKVGNCLRFGTGGWTLCFYPLWSRNI